MIGAVFAYVGRVKAICGDAAELTAPPPELAAAPATAPAIGAAIG